MSGSSSAASAGPDVPQPGDPNYLPYTDPTSNTSVAAEGVSIGGKAAAGAAAGSAAGPVGTVVGAVVGAAVGIWGAITGANDQAEIDRQKAELARQEAAEVARREASNDAVAQETAFRERLDISADMAGAGHAGGSVGTQLEIQRQTNLQIKLNDEAARFQESQLLAGAQMQDTLANQTGSAAVIKSIGYGVTAAGGILSPRSGIVNYSPNEKLPQIGGGF